MYKLYSITTNFVVWSSSIFIAHPNQFSSPITINFLVSSQSNLYHHRQLFFLPSKPIFFFHHNTLLPLPFLQPQRISPNVRSRNSTFSRKQCFPNSRSQQLCFISLAGLTHGRFKNKTLVDNISSGSLGWIRLVEAASCPV